MKCFKKSKKYLKFSLSIFFTFCFIFSSMCLPIFSINVYATDINRPQQTEEEKQWYEYPLYILDNIDTALTTFIGVVADTANRELITDICRQHLVDKGLINVTNDSVSISSNLYDGSNFRFSAEMLLELRNLVEQYMKTKEPYEICYPSGYPIPYYDRNANTRFLLPKDTSAYIKARPFFDKFFSISFGNYRFSLIDSKKFKYAYKSYGYIRLVDSDLNTANAVLSLYVRNGSNSNVIYTSSLDDYSLESLTLFLGEENVAWSDGYEKLAVGTNSEGMSVYRSFHSGITSPFYGQPLQVFNSISDLYDYVNSKPIAYYTSDYYNKTYQDITLNQDIIKNYTTENVQNIYNTINNNSGDALTAEELQNIIDDTVSSGLDKINGSLDDVNKGLDGINKNLDEINSDIKKSNNWLEKIYNRLGDIYKVLVDGYMFEGEDEPDEMYNNLMSADNYAEMVTIFLYGVTSSQQEEILNMVTYYDSVSDMPDDSDMYNISGYDYSFYAEHGSIHSHESGTAIRGKYNGIVGVISHKIPFCIPYDIYETVRIFVDEPETPSFTIPFHVEELNFDYDIVVDLSGFDILSKVSRSITTLFMVISLLIFTKKHIIG